jgi:hypothetical protein
MKNLRKALSLALVVALSLSLVIVAGAKNVGDYPDKDSINPFRIEAVDLLTALGVFEGSDDGNLDPQGTFTRAQAAKIVSYISIGASASNLAQAPTDFSDVPASHWASGYVSFASQRGIINGVGGGKFDPDSSVTGAQLAKLLLVAIGYGAKGEYVGASWELNSIIDGQRKNILFIIGEEVDFSAPATRQQAIQYVFNALTAQIVQYSAAFDSYLDASTSQFVTRKQTNLANESFNTVSSTEYDDFGYEEHYWAQLGVRKTANYASDFVIGSFISNPDVTKGSLYSQYQWDDSINVWINGYQYPTIPIPDTTYGIPAFPSNSLAIRGSTSPALDGAALGAPLIGSLNGIHFDLIDTYPFDGKIGKIVGRYEYLAKVTRVNTVTDTLNFNVYELSGGSATNRPFENIPVDDASEYVRDQYILVTPSSVRDYGQAITPAEAMTGYNYTSSTIHAPIISLKPATVVTTTPSSYTKDRDSSIINSITINSEKKWIAATNFLPVADATTLPNFTQEGVFYLDSNGYIVGFESSDAIAASLQYLYVHAISGLQFGNSGGFGDNRVSVTYPDGTRATPVVAFRNYATSDAHHSAGYETVGTANISEITATGWFAYTTNSDGQVILNDLPITPSNVVASAIGTNVVLTTGTPAINFSTVAGSATTTTVLNINGTKYTGYSRFPTLKANADNKALIVFNQGPNTTTGIQETKGTIAAIYIITTVSAGTGEYGVLLGLAYGGSTNSFTVLNKAGEEEALPDASGQLAVSEPEGTVVEIGIDANGNRQIVNKETTTTSLPSISTDGTYIYGSGHYYYIGENTIIHDLTTMGMTSVATGDDVTIFDAVVSEDAPTSPLSVVVITAHAA